jgi:hypothetical protein
VAAKKRSKFSDTQNVGIAPERRAQSPLQRLPYWTAASRLPLPYIVLSTEGHGPALQITQITDRVASHVQCRYNAYAGESKSQMSTPSACAMRSMLSREALRSLRSIDPDVGAMQFHFCRECLLRNALVGAKRAHVSGDTIAC